MEGEMEAPSPYMQDEVIEIGWRVCWGLCMFVRSSWGARAARNIWMCTEENNSEDIIPEGHVKNSTITIFPVTEIEKST